jgi:hypothetical protein
MTITVIKGNTTIKITLYGPVTPEREELERKVAQHRAEQLA